MRDEYLGLREKLFFKTNLPDFKSECAKAAENYDREYKTAEPARKKSIEWIIGNLAVDMFSYLPDWKLKKTGPDATGVLAGSYALLTGILKKWNVAERLASVEKEVWELVNSNLLRLSRTNDMGLTNTPVGTDAAWELIHSTRNGTSVATTNPVMVDTVRKNYPEVWNPVRDEIAKKYASATDQERVTRFSLEVVLYNCKVVKPIFDYTNGRLGYVHMQVNPHHSDDGVAMAEEAEYVYGELKKLMGSEPNVIFKIPAVAAAQITVPRLLEQGICVNMTACASVSQHKVFGELMKKGKAKLQLLTMMAGRFDDPIVEELKSAGLSEDEAIRIGRQGSTFVLNRSYMMLLDELKANNVWLLDASMRATGNIEATFNSYPQPIFLSIFPPQASEYESVPRAISPNIGKSPEPGLLEHLMKSETFRKGYEWDAMKPEDFEHYKVITATLKQFRERYDETVAYLKP
ncbi:MAG: hypothetical protein LBS53_00315 [Synergistaceae bacterium]|jgi:hypothetical protein|nr:hypothetical protein [Synergistaceae bacterium]